MGIPPRTHLGCSEFSRVNILPVKYRADQMRLNHYYITNKHLFKKNVKAYLCEKLLAVDQDDYIYF